VLQAAAPRRPRVILQNLRTSREVGLHQCPSERKGEGGPVRSLYVRSHVPSDTQTAAKVWGFSPISSGFTAETDWLLEESGFELLVPLVDAGLFGRKREFANDVAGSGNDADRIRVARSPSASAAAEERRGVGTIIGGIRAATRAVGWDRAFESGSLQRRVQWEPDSLAWR
jgi:hypothetical protein